MVRGFQAVGVLLLLSALSFAQEKAGPATVTFALDFPGSQPEHYSLQVQSDGKARYQSSSKISSESEDVDSFDYEFALSPITRARVFELSAKAGYFHDDLDSHRKNMAFTGRKMLRFQDSSRNSEATFNYSPNPAAQELTSIFQSLSATLELGHRLEYSLRYQKLALAEELKRTEESARVTRPVEMQAIAPILQQIVADASVMNVTRARAQRLLDSAVVQ